MAALKDVRDQSNLNRTTPIISAGLADGGLPGRKPDRKHDGVSIPATLHFLRQNGMEKLVDGYGVHAYPWFGLEWLASGFVDDFNKNAFAMCTSAKPCWLTEWGFRNRNQSCPIDDRTRTQLIGTMRNALKQFAEQGRLAAMLIYSWSGLPGAKESAYGIF